MKLLINGQEKSFATNQTIYEILTSLNILQNVQACAVNGEIVRKDSWGEFTPKENDKLEFLDFVGGG